MNTSGDPVSVHVVSPPRVFLAVAALCAAAVPLVLVMGQDFDATRAAIVALHVDAALCLLLAWSWRPEPGPVRRALHCAALVAVGLAAAPLGWYFGPQGGFDGLLALALVLTGMLTGGIPNRHPALAGWLTYLALAAGQGIMSTLIIGGWVPDVSFERVLIPEYSTSRFVVATAALQGIFLIAFLIGRAFQARYRDLVLRVDEALRTAALREALVDEARAEYARALAVGLRGVHSGRTVGDYRLGELLDRRAANVYEAVHVEQGRRVAVRLEGGPGDSRVVRVPFDTISGGYTQATPLPPTEGDDLLAAVRGGVPLPLAEVHALLEDVGGPLAALHAAGKVHLEVRPSTIGRERDGWSLRDVGAVAHGGSPAPEVLRSIAPERLAGAFVDARADVYGLAAALYAALAGRELFADVPVEDLPRAVVFDPPADPGVGAALWRALRPGLAKKPEDRYPGVADLRAAMLAALEGRGAEEPEPDAPPPAAAPAPAPPVAPPSPDDAWRGAYRAKMRGFYLGATALCAGGALLLTYLIRERAALLVALASMAGVVAVAWLHHFMVRRRPDQATYWPWALAGALSAGPAYAVGLHSSFGAIVTVWLFVGGLFRAERPGS